MEKEELILYFLEKEGLKNPRDFFEMEQLKTIVYEKLEDESTDYYKINKLYEDLSFFHKENYGKFKDYYNTLKSLNKLMEDDIDVKKELIFVEEFEDLSSIDHEVNFDNNINLVLKSIVGKKFNISLDNLESFELLNELFSDKSSNKESSIDIKKIFLESFGNKYLGKGFKKLVEFKDNLYQKCLNDRRLFDESGNQINSFSLFFIGRMYLKACLTLYELSVFNDISDVEKDSFKDILKDVSDLQKDVIIYNTREIYMLNLYLRSKFDLYNEELKKIDKNSMSYFILNDPDSFFDFLNSKDKVKELNSRNFFIPFIILDCLNEDIALTTSDDQKLLKLILVPKSFNEAMFFVSLLTSFSTFFKANEELTDLIDAFPDEVSELFNNSSSYEDFIKIGDKYLKDKTIKFPMSFLSSKESFDELKSKKLIFKSPDYNFAISIDFKRLLDSLLIKDKSLKELSFKDYKMDIKSYCSNFDSFKIDDDSEDDDEEEEEKEEPIDFKYLV